MMMLMKMVEGESDTAAESEEEEDGAFTSLSPSLSLTFFLILFSLFLEDAHASPATLPMVCARARAGSKDSDAFITTAPPPHPSFSLAFFLN